MISAYFDASGDEGLPHVAVGGFVSSPNDWTEFDRRWLARLAKDGLSHFRASDFYSYKNQFAEGWRDTERRRALVSDLMEIIQKTAFRKFSTVVRYEDVAARIGDELRSKLKLNAYVLAGRACVSSITRWGEKEPYYGAVNYVFESGDRGAGALLDLLKRHGYSSVSFEPKLDRDEGGRVKRGAVPLQAADWLAHESFRLMRSGEMNRWERKEFDFIPGEIGWLSPHDLIHANQMLDKFERADGIG